MPGDLDLYSWAIFSDFDLGWLAAPLTLLLLELFVLLFRGTPILAGGIGVARVVVGAVLFLLFAVSSSIESVNLLVTRLGLRPYSAWSKKNYLSSLFCFPHQFPELIPFTLRHVSSWHAVFWLVVGTF